MKVLLLFSDVVMVVLLFKVLSPLQGPVLVAAVVLTLLLLDHLPLLLLGAVDQILLAAVLHDDGLWVCLRR